MVKCSYITDKNPSKHVLTVINVTVHGFAHKASTLDSSHYFEECINVCHRGEITSPFRVLPHCTRALQLRDGGAYPADLSQAA